MSCEVDSTKGQPKYIAYGLALSDGQIAPLEMHHCQDGLYHDLISVPLVLYN